MPTCPLCKDVEKECFILNLMTFGFVRVCPKVIGNGNMKGLKNINGIGGMDL